MSKKRKKFSKKYNGLVVKKIEVWYNMTKCKRMHWYVKKLTKQCTVLRIQEGR